MATNITIVGGGPVGCYAAKLLARMGKEVNVLEEHSTIGKPVQCTGIVTRSLAEVVRIRKEFLVNRLKKVRLHAPCGDSVDVRVDDIVIDRSAFDKHIAEMAQKAGVRILLKSKLVGIKNSAHQTRLRVLDTRTKNRTKKVRTCATDVLVGADGPKSIVARSMGNRKPSFLVGVQAVVRMPVDKDTYSVYFGDRFPGFFGWVVPEDENKARIGIATAKNPRLCFNRFMKQFKRCKIVEMQGGLIPVYNPQTIVQKNNSYVLGDAATQVKATTGGGLVPGMKAAECLAQSIDSGKSYKSELISVDRELKMSLMLRNILDRFNEKDYDKMVAIVGSKRIKKILNKENRDRPSRIVFKSIIKEPKLLLFARTLLRAKRVENA
jgi:geranylgeranyl reductase family protein